MKTKVLTNGTLTVSRHFYTSNVDGMVSIKDLETDAWITIYPKEAQFLYTALGEVLSEIDASNLPSNPPSDGL